ncbi:MAG: monofunctional biosynthetic peptidoglycan transglycosylase [Fibrobacteria bacterium]|nr:monofunctional biosynthetic peptidoglycan transglycosylase [Fibrobacteria bacterium]
MICEKERIEKDSVLLKSITKQRSIGGHKPLIWQEWVAWNSIPELIRDLVIISEDGKFYQHNGFDLNEIEYAIVANHQLGKKFRGASTISQQVVKNLFLAPDKSYLRKIKEGLITLVLEDKLSKKRILEIYLNIAQFGPGVFGVQAASLYHFNKPVAELNFDQIVNLIALLPSPIKWRPYCGYQAYINHKKRIINNLSLYKQVRKKVSDEDYESFKKYAEEDERMRWNRLQDQINPKSDPLEDLEKLLEF